MDDVETLEDYFVYFREELPNRDTLDLLLMSIGSRPSCLIMNTDEDEAKKLESFCNKMNFFYRIEEGKSRISGKSVFITSEESRLDLLVKDEGRFCGFTDTAVGNFLDFPAEDAKYFSNNISDGQIEPLVRKKMSQMIENDLADEEDREFVEIASYVPKPETDNILQCIEAGKSHREAIRTFDKENNTDLGKNVVEEFLNNY